MKSHRVTSIAAPYNCSIDNSKISKIEHGKFDIRISTILELSKGLEIHPKDLFDFEMDTLLL